MIDAMTLKKSKAIATIDAMASYVRRRFVSSSIGGADIARKKLAEAQDFLVNGGTPGPYLAAEAAARGRTATQAANLITAAAQQYDSIVGPQSEKARVQAAVAVNALSDPLTVDDDIALILDTMRSALSNL